MILVSACLLGENCKYDGGNNFSEKIKKVLEGQEYICVCPEVSGGLSVPRIPAEIRDGVVINKEGQSVDENFRKGAEIALKAALDNKVTKAILKSRSPSCGSGKIYDGTFSGQLTVGDGVFAALLKENGIQVISSDEI